MSSNTSASPEPAQPAVVAVKEPATKARASRKIATTKKPAAAVKAKATPKSKSVTKTATKTSKVKVATTTSSHPAWKQIVTECIVDNKEDARQGVSRATIKKYAEDKYQLESTAANIYQLNRAITTGAEAGIFTLPKGPSGKVKLAAKTKAVAGGAKEKVASVKKPVPAKKVLAGKAKAPAPAKKATTKRGTAKKAVTGTTSTTKAKAAATKKAPVKKRVGVTTAAAASKTASGTKTASRPATTKVGLGPLEYRISRADASCL
ncbi:hypothetical protein C0991_008851 [Blastosporella zonata]|nr:hypothetical protein C0991_008851 [Blastosporella zonata]